MRAGYGETVVLEDVALALPERGSLAVLGRNGVGKTTLLATIMGHTTLHAGDDRLQSAMQHQQMPVYERARLGIGYVPQEREIFPSLSVEENLDRRRAPRALDARARLRPVSAAGRAPPPLRQPDLRRRAADARHRPRADGQPVAAAAWTSRSRDWRPIIVENLLLSLKKLLTEDALAIILVEQHAKLALQVTQDARWCSTAAASSTAGPSADAARRPGAARQPGRRAVAGYLGVVRLK